jgi:hypothetical protein
MIITDNKIINKIIQISGLSNIFTSSFKKKRFYNKIKNEHRMKKILRWRLTAVFIILKKDFEQYA